MNKKYRLDLSWPMFYQYVAEDESRMKYTEDA